MRTTWMSCEGRMKKEVLGLLVLSVVLTGASAQSIFKTPFSVVGDGCDYNRTFSGPVQLAPGTTYLFSFAARRVGGGSGTVVTGPDFANVDWDVSDPVATVRRFVFRTPEGTKPGNGYTGIVICRRT